MVTAIVGKQISWSGSRDRAAHRTWKIKFLIIAGTLDGPALVMQTPGLPVPGAWWLVDNDADVWAWCRPDMTVNIHKEREGDPNYWWIVECTFSTEPLMPYQQRPQNIGGAGSGSGVQDPLSEPAKITGTSVRYSKELALDRFGEQILTSSFEPMRGPQVEFDANRDTIEIDQNTATYADIANAYALRDHVNSVVLWNQPITTVKLAAVNWSRQYYGAGYVYYQRKLSFDVDNNVVNFSDGSFPMGFDRVVHDESNYAIGKFPHYQKPGEGAGCTVNLNTQAPDGKIIAPILLQNGGAGYPKNASFTLIVDGTGFAAAAAGGIIRVHTNAAGQVIDFQVPGIVNGGTAYANWVGVPTIIPPNNWVADDIDGKMVDPKNPMHFCVYKDPSGENRRVLLDGLGWPCINKNLPGAKFGYKIVQAYDAVDFSVLGIPLVF